MQIGNNRRIFIINIGILRSSKFSDNLLLKLKRRDSLCCLISLVLLFIAVMEVLTIILKLYQNIVGNF